MTTLREAAQMALEALEYAEQNHGGDDCYFDAIEALRAALTQPEQEPQQREWQGLTDEEYESMAENHVTDYFFDTLKYAHAIEAKLKEKNT